MKKAVKSDRRIKLLEAIAKDIVSHERFDENVKRRASEIEIQLSVFQRLEKLLLNE